MSHSCLVVAHLGALTHPPTHPPARPPPAGASSPLGPAIGATNLHSLVQLLAGRGGANCAAAAMQLPAGSLPASMQALAISQDARLAGGAGPSAGGGAREIGPASARSSTSAGGGGAGELSVQHAALLSGGLQMAAVNAGCLAESITLRGARRGGQAAATAQAAAALDALLLGEQRPRSVQHRCIVPMPMCVPLPYPRIFKPGVSYHGDLAGAGASSAGAAPGRGGGEVGTCPVLTRLIASSAHEQLLARTAAQLKQAAASVAGASTMAGWGYSGADVDELQERLVMLASRYQEDDL